MISTDGQNEEEEKIIMTESLRQYEEIDDIDSSEKCPIDSSVLERELEQKKKAQEKQAIIDELALVDREIETEYQRLIHQETKEIEEAV